MEAAFCQSPPSGPGVAMFSSKALTCVKILKGDHHSSGFSGLRGKGRDAKAQAQPKPFCCQAVCLESRTGCSRFQRLQRPFDAILHITEKNRSFRTTDRLLMVSGDLFSSSIEGINASVEISGYNS